MPSPHPIPAKGANASRPAPAARGPIAKAIAPIAPTNQKLEIRNPKCSPAFTLVELLIVIAVIAIMASLVISAFSNAAADSRLVLARQQQAVVQQALNGWIAYQSASPRSLAQARAEYEKPAHGTGFARLGLIQAYLDAATFKDFEDNTDAATPNVVQSEVMARVGQSLQITDWPANSYPQVLLQ